MQAQVGVWGGGDRGIQIDLDGAELQCHVTTRVGAGELLELRRGDVRVEVRRALAELG
jgi:hypothetical protein